MKNAIKSSVRLVLPLLCVTVVFGVTPEARIAAAAQEGDSAAIRKLLTEGAGVNVSQPDGTTALAWASYRDDLEAANILIRAGANPNATNDNGVGPLFLACANGSATMVDFLLNAGANPNAALEWSGQTVLMRCAETGSIAGVKSLLAKKASVNAKDSVQGHTALMRAIAKRHPEVAGIIVDRGADVNAHAKSGFTALMFAAQQGDLTSAQKLVDVGAKVNEATNAEAMWKGQTALLIASLNGHEQLGMFLLDNGADPKAADENGLTALHFCLLRGLARVSGVQPRAYTPFLNRPNMVNLLKALLAHGADPNARIKSIASGNEFYKSEASPYRPYEPVIGTINPVGATAFLIAAINYDSEIMRILVDAGADPKLVTEDNVTPLMVAATMGRAHWTTLNANDSKRSLESVKLAVELGTDVNAADKSLGITALHAAAYSGSDDVIRFLAEHGANVNASDKSGNSPLDVAVVGETADGGAGNRRPSLRWEGTAGLLTKLGATSSPSGARADANQLKLLKNEK